MTADQCKHEHGAHVDQFACWVCGQCFQKLECRPTRYGMVRSHGKEGGTRQQIVWQAEERKSEHGLTLADFLRTMAKRMVHRCRSPLHLTTAFQAALDALQALGDQFCDPAYDWSHGGAREMADEEMTYWEEEGAESND